MPPVAKKPGATRAPGREVDLDAARAARAEAEGRPVTVKMRGETFTLPVELPAEFAFAQQHGDLREIITALFDSVEAAERFFALRPSVEDLRALSELAAAVYGLTPGESEPSAAS